jgi:hypothetical protein
MSIIFASEFDLLEQDVETDTLHRLVTIGQECPSGWVVFGLFCVELFLEVE